MASKKFKKVRCKSGEMGERFRLRDSYSNFEEFKSYSETYGLVNRLGYKSAETAWRWNPVVESSTNPSDFRKVPKREQ